MKSVPAKILIFLILTLVIFEAIQFLVRYDQAKQLSQGTQATSYYKEEPEFRILIAGDSIGEGVGAGSSSTIAAFFHKDFPEAEIINISESGHRTRETLRSLRRIEGSFDLILLFSGANDILYLTSLDKAEENMRELLRKSKELSDDVVLATSGNIGLAPIFPEPVAWYFSYRTRKFLKEFASIAKEEKVTWVDLYKAPEEDLLSNSPQKYYAPDMLHLSGEGYEIWYDEIRHAMGEKSKIK